MIRIKLMVWAHNVSIDKLDNTPSIISLIDEVSAPEMPAVLRTETKLFALLVRDENDPKKFISTIKVQQDKKDLIVPFNLEINFGEHIKNRIVIGIPPILLKKEKEVVFSISKGKLQLGSYVAECFIRPTS